MLQLIKCIRKISFIFQGVPVESVYVDCSVFKLVVSGYSIYLFFCIPFHYKIHNCHQKTLGLS